MAVFTSSVFALRRKMITEALRNAGAVSPESPRALSDTGLENPDLFAEFTARLVDMDVIRRTPDGRFYVHGRE